MAAKQEMIRKRMQELRQELSGDQQAKQNIDRMIQQMEETETDIINRNISQQTLKRQEEILDKLLDAEKASRERDKEEEENPRNGSIIFQTSYWIPWKNTKEIKKDKKNYCEQFLLRSILFTKIK